MVVFAIPDQSLFAGYMQRRPFIRKRIDDQVNGTVNKIIARLHENQF